MKYPELVAGAFIVCKNQIFLVQKVGSSHWVIPGGHIEVGETSEQAVKREILEETQIHLTSLQFLRHVNFQVSERHFFGIDFVSYLDVFPEKIALNEELSHSKWFHLKDAKQDRNVPLHIQEGLNLLRICN